MKSEWQSAANSGSVEQFKRLLTDNDINSLNRYSDHTTRIIFTESKLTILNDVQEIILV